MRPTKKSAKEKSSDKLLEKLSSLEKLLKKKDDQPFNFKEACAYLGFAPSYLYKLTYRKIIPHYKPSGKMLFFSKVELDEWIFSKEQSAERKANVENEDEEDEESDASNHTKYDYE